VIEVAASDVSPKVDAHADTAIEQVLGEFAKVHYGILDIEKGCWFGHVVDKDRIREDDDFEIWMPVRVQIVNYLIETINVATLHNQIAEAKDIYIKQELFGH
jgi:hypothetical protein